MVRRWRLLAVVLALAFGLTASIGASVRVSAPESSATATNHASGSVDVLASSQAALPVWHQSPARTVPSVSRELTTKFVVRYVSILVIAAATLAGTVLAITWRRRWRTDSAHLVFVASASSRRGPPLVA